MQAGDPQVILERLVRNALSCILCVGLAFPSTFAAGQTRVPAPKHKITPEICQNGFPEGRWGYDESAVIAICAAAAEPGTDKFVKYWREVARECALNMNSDERVWKTVWNAPLVKGKFKSLGYEGSQDCFRMFQIAIKFKAMTYEELIQFQENAAKENKAQEDQLIKMKAAINAGNKALRVPYILFLIDAKSNSAWAPAQHSLLYQAINEMAADGDADLAFSVLFRLREEFPLRPSYSDNIWTHDKLRTGLRALANHNHPEASVLIAEHLVGVALEARRRGGNAAAQHPIKEASAALEKAKRLARNTDSRAEIERLEQVLNSARPVDGATVAALFLGLIAISALNQKPQSSKGSDVSREIYESHQRRAQQARKESCVRDSYFASNSVSGAWAFQGMFC
jgi:hypothetical protein